MARPLRIEYEVERLRDMATIQLFNGSCFETSDNLLKAYSDSAQCPDLAKHFSHVFLELHRNPQQKFPNLPAVPEVIGDAGLMVNPLDVDELSLAIPDLLDKPEKRELYSQKGLLYGCP